MLSTHDFFPIPDSYSGIADYSNKTRMLYMFSNSPITFSLIFQFWKNYLLSERIQMGKAQNFLFLWKMFYFSDDKSSVDHNFHPRHREGEWNLPGGMTWPQQKPQ